jgi:hypothetical protein
MKINCYLGIVNSLLIFFCLVLLYKKYISKFQVVPVKKYKKCVTFDDNVYQNDSRYRYPYEPPVNPITKLSRVIDRIIPEKDLYTPFDNFYEINDSEHSILDNPELNELNYSGGSTKLIKIPLQMNEPNHFEQLRSQNVLVTPYNKVKYGEN